MFLNFQFCHFAVTHKKEFLKFPGQNKKKPYFFFAVQSKKNLKHSYRKSLEAKIIIMI